MKGGCQQLRNATKTPGGNVDSRHVVRYSEAFELTLLIEVVDGLQCHFIRRRAVGAVEVPHVDRTTVAV